MIEFKNKVAEILPYERKEYIKKQDWFGVSIQLPGVFEGREIEIEEYLLHYENLFNKLILYFDNANTWIVNHDFIDEDWFPNKQRNLKLLRLLFKKEKILNTFSGAIVFDTTDLLKFSKDIISYPFSIFNKKNILYNNLDISNSKIPIVIKISAHSTIDLLCKDLLILKKCVHENISSPFLVKEYRGTRLLDM